MKPTDFIATARYLADSTPRPVTSWWLRPAIIPELLDRAVWRRFQIRLELPAPTQGQTEEWFRRFEKRHEQPLGLSPRSLAQRRGLSFAEVEDFGTDVLLQITLQQPNADVEAIVERRLRHWRQRYTAHE